MSLKNYIFSSIHTKGALDSDKFVSIRLKSFKRRQTAATILEENGTNVQNPQAATVQSNARHPPNQSHKGSILKQLVKIWKNITVEPLMLCWILPSCLLIVLVENLALEKSCRVDFGYDDIVCDNMIDKTIMGINCVTFREKVAQLPNETIHLYRDRSQVFDEKTFKNGSLIAPFGVDVKILFDITQLEEDVCRAEIDSQILETHYTLYTAPFDVIFGILMILFAGGWSDRVSRRKPCMLIPMFGELAALLAMLVSVVFFKQLPLWFSSILGKLLPAMAGGANLMLMGVYSYLSEITSEEDRTFRFGIFAEIIPIIPLLSVPWSGYLFNTLGYIKLILLCIPINLMGILYILFVLKEVKRETNDENVEHQTADVDSEVFENEPNMHVPEFHKAYGRRLSISAESAKERNFLVNFFNPIVVIQCCAFLMQKRKNQGQIFLIFLLILYFVAIGPGFGEEPNEYNFGRIRLNWAGEDYSSYSTYGIFLSLVGTLLMLSVLNKWLKFSDPALGFIGTSISAVSRIIYCMATTTAMMYFARTFDAFISIRALVIKSILSKLVATDELGRLFSIIGIIEAFGKFVFVSVYSLIYSNTLDTWPAAFYFFSLIFLVIAAILFASLHYIVKRRDRQEAAQKTDLSTAENNETDVGDTTHM